MANSRQAKKRARQSLTRFKVNHSRMVRIRTFTRRVEEAIAKGDAEVATLALRKAQSEMMRGIHRGLLHKNTVSRKVSRLNTRIKAILA